MRIERKKIIVDDELYPRNQADWLTAYRYADAMRSGATFPPCVVGQRGPAFVLLDGRHRLLAYAQNKIDRVPCLVSRVPPKAFLFEAIRLNAANGRPLSIQERIQGAARLKAAGYSLGQIGKALFMSLPSLERLIADRVVTPPRVAGGLALVRKAPVPSHDDLKSEAQQKPLAAASILSILQQATVIFANGWVDLADEAIAEQVAELSRALDAAQRAAREARQAKSA